MITMRGGTELTTHADACGEPARPGQHPTHTAAKSLNPHR